jgi:cobalt/nickel transport system permease protein
MHMADALLSPAVGGTMWLATASTIAGCARKLRQDLDDRKVPLMGVLGAFIFAAQMINFSIPATGSSGHLGGGLILAILLGPWAAFLTIASVLMVQALFFADGGLLALGCNIFNLGVFPCFLAYPLIYLPIAGGKPSPLRISIGATIAAIIGLQLGAFGVVVETVASGVSELPFRAFLSVMLPIHLAIGLVEGLVTAAVVTFVWRVRPEILEAGAARRAASSLSMTRLVAVLGLVAALTGGLLSWFASSAPDGLEWSVAKVAGEKPAQAPSQGIHQRLADIQDKISFLPDYGFKADKTQEGQPESSPPSMQKGGTSVAGLIGGGLTLVLALAIGLLFRKRNRTA